MILPEIVTVGIYNSSVSHKGIRISDMRKTKWYEIELPIDRGGISYIDSDSMPISTDILICAKPGQTRHTKFPYKCYAVHLVVNDEALNEKLNEAPNFIVTSDFEYYKFLYSKLFKYYDSGFPDDEIILQSIVLELIYKILRDTNRIATVGKIKNTNYLAVKEVAEYIKCNLTSDLSLEKAAELAHLSPTYFHNVFKAVMGKTLREYVEEQRLKKAIVLLTTTDHSLTRIAYECGFSSQSYFSYVFKRRMHKTPREYVQEIYSKYEI